MSIAENHGGLYQNLKELRDTEGRSSCNFFRSLGLDYLYGRGNDIPSLIAAFAKVKDTSRPTVVHIHTQKGRDTLRQKPTGRNFIGRCLSIWKRVSRRWIAAVWRITIA